MRARIPGRPHAELVVRLGALGSDWESPPVVVASRFRTRLRGLRPAPFGWGLLIGSGAVHGRGLAAAIRVVAVFGRGLIGESRLLAPDAALRLPGAVAVLELPADSAVPPPGSTLHCVSMLAPWPDD